eukprot:4035797-Amphidinium_carterae.1
MWQCGAKANLDAPHKQCDFMPSSWGSWKRQSELIVDVADVVCVQELHLSRSSLHDAKHWSLRQGYKMQIEPAKPTDHGHGTMGGVGVGVRPYIGMRASTVSATFDLLQGRVTSAVLGGIVRGGLQIISVYMLSGGTWAQYLPHLEQLSALRHKVLDVRVLQASLACTRPHVPVIITLQGRVRADHVEVQQRYHKFEHNLPLINLAPCAMWSHRPGQRLLLVTHRLKAARSGTCGKIGLIKPKGICAASGTRKFPMSFPSVVSRGVLSNMWTITRVCNIHTQLQRPELGVT